MTETNNASKPVSDVIRSPFVLDLQQGEIIRTLRQRQNISRPEVVRITGWSRAKATLEINRLLGMGLIKEIGEGPSEGGRRPRLLSLNNELGYLVGVDIGATSIDVALADFCGKVIEIASEPTDVRFPPEIVLGRCTEIMLELLKKNGATPEKVLGVGVGVPGPVEFSKGILVAPPLMPAWEGYSIRSFFQQIVHSALIVVDNDVNIMANGELRVGDARGIDHFIFIKIGTGIGAGVVSNGRIHRGASGCAGDIGHISVDKNGPVCRCGNIGCLEAVTAGPAIADAATKAVQAGTSPVLARIYKERNGELRAEDVGAAIREGDRASVEIVQNSGKIIGETLASLVNFFNPSHIIVGGGVTQLGDQLLLSIRQAVLKRSLPLATRHLVIKYSSLGSKAGIMGAIFLAQDHLIWVMN